MPALSLASKLKFYLKKVASIFVYIQNSPYIALTLSIFINEVLSATYFNVINRQVAMGIRLWQPPCHYYAPGLNTFLVPA